MIDWKSLLRPGMRGVVVEGKDDRIVLEAFLDAGEKQGYWSHWRGRLVIVEARGSERVLKELNSAADDYDVWGILDMDWRPDEEIEGRSYQYSNLMFLPRIMIENFFINPDEWSNMLPSHQQLVDIALLRTKTEIALAEWIKHGALSQVLYENGAYDFCRGGTGYPRQLIDGLVADEAEIISILESWRVQLDPTVVLSSHRAKVTKFQSYTQEEQYRLCVDGKSFFRQMLVEEIFNKHLGQADASTWLERLSSQVTDVPSDLLPILNQLIL